MFLCFSEINISVIVEHGQHNGIIRAFCAWGNLLSFLVPWGTEQITELWLARGISTQAGTMIYILVFLLLKFAHFPHLGKSLSRPSSHQIFILAPSPPPPPYQKLIPHPPH